MSRIVGHLDGIIDDVVYGWLANLDDPSALEQVSIRDENGNHLTFSPLVYRADVCRALGVDGLFGFAIRRHWLNAFGNAITALDRKDNVLVGGDNVQLPMLADQAAFEPEPLDIFLHLPKTAGTSVRTAILSQVRAAETLLIYQDPAFGMAGDCIRAIPAHQRRQMRLAFGHCSYGMHDILGVPSRYSMIMRDPATRLRSNFAHHAAAGTVFRAGGGVLDPVDVVNDGLAEEFDNLMVRVVAGLMTEERPPGAVSNADVELALHNIRTRFKFIGLYETMDESFAGLCDALGLQRCALPRDNVTPATRLYSDRQMEAIDWRHVLERNRHDCALYEAVKKAGLVGRIEANARSSQSNITRRARLLHIASAPGYAA